MVSAAWIICNMHTYMIKSSERSRENKVINILDTSDSNGGDHSQEFAISEFNSATQVHIKPLYEILHLSRLGELLTSFETYRVFGSYSAQGRKHSW